MISCSLPFYSLCSLFPVFWPSVLFSAFSGLASFQGVVDGLLQVVEVGPPQQLLAKPEGPQAFFRAMMAQTE